MRKDGDNLLGTDEECGSSDIAHYYAVEKEAPMTFSPDGAFPVVNIEKGHLNCEFEAEFEPSQALPRVKSVTAGTKVNVVPGKAYAVFEGLDDDMVREANTILSKANDLEVSDCAIALKTEIEKVREQIQNIE